MDTAGKVEEIGRATARDKILIAARKDGEASMAGDHDKVLALLEAAAVLERLGRGYALIGGVAVGIHSGVPRATLDTDFAVLSNPDRERLVSAMTAAGFKCVGEYEHSINFRHANSEPVQIAFDPFFDAMIARAETISVRGQSVAIVGKDDLVAMKVRAAADPARRKSKSLRDRADIELLQGDTPDPDEGW